MLPETDTCPAETRFVTSDALICKVDRPVLTTPISGPSLMDALGFWQKRRLDKQSNARTRTGNTTPSDAVTVMWLVVILAADKRPATARLLSVFRVAAD